MPAFPFGGHPTFAQYIGWARGRGCTARSGVLSDDSGRVFTATQLLAESGKKVTTIGVRHDERLPPTTIAYLDRRLGLQSPFFSIDDSEIIPEEAGDEEAT